MNSITDTSEQSTPINLPSIIHLDIIWWVVKRVGDIVNWKSTTDAIPSQATSPKIGTIIGKNNIWSIKWVLLKIKKSYQQKLVDFYIKRWEPLAIVYFLDNYSLLDPKIYHSKIVDAVIQRWQEYMLVEYLDKFTELDSELYHPKIMETLIVRWDSKRVIDNLPQFHRFNPNIAYILIEEYKSSILAMYLKKFTDLDYSKIIHALIERGEGNIDYFIINSPVTCRKNIADALIKNDQQWYIRNHFEKFSELDPGIYHPLLFDFILERWEMLSITEMAEKFTGLDAVRREKLSELIELARYTQNTPNDIMSQLDRFTALTPTEFIHTTMRALGGQFIVDNLERFTLLEHSKIAELLMQKTSWGWSENTNIRILAKNLEKFIGLNPKIYHPKIVDTLAARWEAMFVMFYKEQFTGLHQSEMVRILIARGQLWIILERLDKFHELNPKFKTFLTKVQSKKSDIEILKRYGDLSSIRWFDDVFTFYIQNKQKSLILLMQKLLIAKDIGIQTSFRSISNLIDTSWTMNTDPKEAKIRLIRTFEKLSEFTGSTSWKIEFDNFLKHVKIFDETNINLVQQKLANLVEKYFNTIYDKKVKQRFISGLWLSKIDNLDEVLAKPEIIEWFKMYQSTRTNKDQFKQILQHAINNPNSTWDISTLEKNKKWLEKPLIKDKNMKIWQERNEHIFDIWETATKWDKTKDIEHFVNVANHKLDLLWLEPQKDAGSLVNYFNTEAKEKIEEFRKGRELPSVGYEELYNDLVLQIQSLNDLFKESKAREITSITIYKETDPAKVLRMGNVVDGSCLSFYSTVWNYWSTATNALDINKWVFFTEDQNGNIIGRVLTAIDNEWKLLRFRTYVKWNIEVDLSSYFNEYIKSLAEKIWLGLNGDIRKVDLLNGKKWYEDPVEMIP